MAGAVAGLVWMHVGGGAVVPAMAAGAFGGLLPDWDHPRSWIGRWVPWPAITHARGPSAPPAVGRRGWPHPIWHRHQAHSVVGVALAVGVLAAGWALLHLAVPALPDLMPALLVSTFIGGLSHLVLDGFNVERQWWAWPLSHRGFRWPVHARIQRADPVAFWAVLSIGGWTVWTWTRGFGHA
jgi:inner membrane protein